MDNSKPLARGIVFIFGISIIFLNFYPIFDIIRIRSYFSMGLLLGSFLLKKHLDGKTPSVFDYFLGTFSVIVFSYIFYAYPHLVERGGYLSSLDFFMGLLGLMIIISSAYIYNRNLFYLTIAFLLYSFLGKYFPYSISHSGFSLSRIIQHLFWGSQGVFGVAIGVAFSYIFIFMIFGEFLLKSGLSEFINDLSLALIGHRAGGPAKVAVLASAMMGTINGSAVANVATTGTVTIPMMKRIGYKPVFAAGVEAVSSTGGQFAPPIMGAVGFIMAEYLNIPYSKVILAASLPAFLYFFGIMVSVDLEARKEGLVAYDRRELPDLKKLLKTRGYLMLPLILVITMILLGYSPLYSAMFGILGTIIVGQFVPEKALNLRGIYNAIISGSLKTLGIGIACLNIGIIIGLVSLTGLGLNFGNLLMGLEGNGSLFIAGFLTMIMSIILGMGVPGLAAYVIISSVSAPILVKMGANPIGAHMFCLIYACLSNITPPVAISSYLAAGIAGADPLRTSLQAVKLGASGFILPFYFLINPILLLGTYENIRFFPLLGLIVSATIGIFALSSSLVGYLQGKLAGWERLALFLAGLIFIDSSVATDLLGLAILTIVLISRRRNERTN